MQPAEPIAAIVDIVESRSLRDRAGAQAAVLDALRLGERLVEVTEAASATVGDEFQAIYADLGDALVATLAASLALPDGIDIRFGLGAGETRHIDAEATLAIQDGPGWWHARDSIDAVRDLARVRVPSARTWFTGGDAATQATVRAYLLARDHIVDSLSERGRRLALGLLDGRTQASLAEDEGISRSAVSQAVRSGGIGALVRGALAFQQVRA